MEWDTHSRWRLPPSETLPETDATLEQIIRFAHSVDPTAHFHDRWAEEYRTNAQALWHRCVQSYKAEAAAAAPDAPTAAKLALSLALERNPAPGDRVRACFTLPSASPATLEVLDVLGRRVGRLAVGALGAGRHVLALPVGARLTPGLYLVRLTQGASVRTARAVVLR